MSSDTCSKHRSVIGLSRPSCTRRSEIPCESNLCSSPRFSRDEQLVQLYVDSIGNGPENVTGFEFDHILGLNR